MNSNNVSTTPLIQPSPIIPFPYFLPAMINANATNFSGLMYQLNACFLVSLQSHIAEFVTYGSFSSLSYNLSSTIKPTSPAHSSTIIDCSHLSKHSTASSTTFKTVLQSNGLQQRRNSMPVFQEGVTAAFTYDTVLFSDGRIKNSSVYKYSCNLCCKSHPRLSNLSRHMQMHLNPNSAFGKKCPDCDKIYVSMTALDRHVLTHKMQHKCHICDKSFSRPWLLQSHLRSHSGNKPFSCAHCGRAFTSRNNLKVHMKVYTDHKTHECGVCGRSFPLHSYLNKHPKAHMKTYTDLTQDH